MICCIVYLTNYVVFKIDLPFVVVVVINVILNDGSEGKGGGGGGMMGGWEGTRERIGSLFLNL